MSSSFGRMQAGMIFILIDIDFGSFDVIPDFIGYLLIASAAIQLYRKTKDVSFRNVNYIAVFLMIVNLVNIFMPNNSRGAGLQMNSISFVMTVVTMLSTIHLYYYLYNGMLRIVESFRDVKFNNKLLSDRNIYVYVNLVIAMLISLSPYISWIYETGIFLILVIIVGLILNLIAIVNVNSIKVRLRVNEGLIVNEN